MAMDKFKVKKNNCPTCNYTLDAASPVGHSEKPKEGDRSICFKCGEWLIFSNKLDLLKMTDLERSQVDERTKSVFNEIEKFIETKTTQ